MGRCGTFRLLTAAPFGEGNQPFTDLMRGGYGPLPNSDDEVRAVAQIVRSDVGYADRKAQAVGHPT